MEFNRVNMKKILVMISFALILHWLLQNISWVGEILSGLLSLLAPFLLGLCIAFVLNLILCPLEKGWKHLWHKKRGGAAEKLRRPLCLTLSVLLLLGAISLFFFVLLPQLQSTVRSISVLLPGAAEKLQAWWMSVVTFFAGHNITLPVMDLEPGRIMKTVSDFFTENGGYVVNKTMDITISIASGLMNVVLGFVFSLYVLAQKEKLGNNAKKLLYALFKKKYADRLIHLLSLTGDTFSRFVSGQVTEAIILGTLCFIGMSILRLPYALVISVVICFTALIPIFGAWVGAIVGAFLIVFADPVKALWFLIFLVLLQQLESNLIYPKVVGSSVGLPGLWVLVAVTVGGSAFGVTGMLFAVPVFSVVYALIGELVESRTPSASSIETEKNSKNGTEKKRS